MAVPVTPRNSPDFNRLGLVYAAVLGLTNPTYAGNANLQMIPNMDGFPNGRRLEDDGWRLSGGRDDGEGGCHACRRHGEGA